MSGGPAMRNLPLGECVAKWNVEGLSMWVANQGFCPELGAGRISKALDQTLQSALLRRNNVLGSKMTERSIICASFGLSQFQVRTVYNISGKSVKRGWG